MGRDRSTLISSLWALRVARAPLARAAVLWLALHVFIGIANGGLVFNFAQIRFVVIVAGVVGYIDSRRRHETTFLGNLGIPAYLPPLLWAGTVIVLETLLRLGHAILV